LGDPGRDGWVIRCSDCRWWKGRIMNVLMGVYDGVGVEKKVGEEAEV